MTKRRATEAAAMPNAKKERTDAKVHPFFSSPAATGKPGPSRGEYIDAIPSLVHYHYNDPLVGPPPDKPVPIVLYDLDGTLVRPKSGKTHPTDRNDWVWWSEAVPQRLKDDVAAGMHVVVLSNQGFKVPKKTREWRAKLPLISEKLGDIPIRFFGALEKDVYRKPRTGMWDHLVDLYKAKGWEVDVGGSIFVGDACGRMGDHSNTDLTMALNAGLKFATPEEHFLGKHSPYPNPPKAFRPGLSLKGLPPVVPSNTPIARDTKEMVLFIGPPASGKTSFYRRHFDNYAHINQDTLRTRDACVRAARASLGEGRSVVIDNTNRDKKTRKFYLDLAKELRVPVRAFHFACPLDIAEHNNVYRALYGPKDEPVRSVLPTGAFGSYKAEFDAPKRGEGYEEIRTVNFVWEGTEEQRALWDRYLF